MKKTNTGHAQEQPLNCCVMTMGIKHAEQLVLLFGKTRVIQLMNQLSEQAQHLLPKRAQIAQLSDYRLLFLLPSYTRLDALRLVYDLDDCCDAIAQQLYAARLALSFGICLPYTLDTLEDAIQCAEYCRLHDRDCERFSTSYAFYSRQAKEQLHHRYQLEQKILNALHRQEFELFLQPKVNTKTRQVVGAEALLRWIHNGVCIPLQEFLPVADQNTCIRLLDTYMFERVCQLLAQRHAQGQPLLPISINVSKASFEDGHYYLGEILDICKRYGVDTSLLELELHEDIPFEHKEQVQMFVQRLKGAGLRCSLDDFGSSRCNLHVLSWIDVDMVKLDHSFFAGPWNSRQQILLQHIIPMLHRLHIPILAEGVETQEQVQFLTDLHCTLIQGFYYSPPVSVHQFFQENEIIE